MPTKHMRDDPFVQFLAEQKDKRFYLTGVEGNAGDTLLKYGLVLHLHEHGYHVVSEASKADILLIHGGSNISDLYGVGFNLLANLFEQYSQKTIVVAPHTYEFPDTDFAALLNDARSDVYLFAREAYSYERLKRLDSKPHVKTYIANDTAFLLEGTKYLESLRAQSESKCHLFAFRTDRESTINTEYIDWSPRTPAERAQYYFLLRRIKAFAKEHHRDVVTESNVYYKDVAFQSYKKFVQDILEAQVLYTDRLHVAILGALLKKPVHLYPTRYDKIQGVFEQLLGRFPTVTGYFLDLPNPLSKSTTRASNNTESRKQRRRFA